MGFERGSGRRRRTAAGAVVVLVAIITGLAAGAGPTTSPSTNALGGDDDDRARLTQALDDLGSADAEVREKATRYLWSLGDAAAEPLRELVAGGDPESAARARALLAKIEAGLRPDTPKQILDLFLLYRSGNRQAKLRAATGLLATGPGGARMLARLWIHERDAQMRDDVGRLLAKNARVYVPALLSQGQESTAAGLLEAGAATGEGARDYAAYLLVKGTIADKVAAIKQTRGTNGRAAPDGWLFLAGGDIEDARRIAERTGDEDLLSAVRFTRGDWKSLAREHEMLAVQNPDSQNHMNLAAAFHHLAGNAAQLDVALARVAAYAKKNPDNNWIEAEVFMLTGRVDGAMGLLTAQQSTPQSTFELLCAQLRFDEALALADETFKKPAGKGQSHVGLHLALAKTHWGLGEAAKAHAALDEAVKLAAAGGGEAGWAQSEIARLESGMGLRERAVARAVGATDPTTAERTVQGLFPVAEQAVLWWRTLRDEPSSATPRERFDQLEQLLAGKLPPDRFKQLAEAARASTENLKESYARTNQLQLIGHALLVAGLEAEADACAQDVARLGSWPARMADRAIALGKWDLAARYYAMAGESGSGRRGAEGIDSGQVRATWLQGFALTKAGKAEQGRALMDLAKLMPLASADAREELAQAMGEHGLAAEAMEQWAMISRLHDFWSAELSNASRHLAAAAATRGEFAKAAALLERSTLLLYRTEAGFTEITPYLSIPRLQRHWRARALVDAGDVDGAWRIVKADAKLLPGEVDWTIEWVTLLDQHGRKAQASELFDTNLRILESVCERYPRAANHHNSLAWLASRCGRELDIALRHAEAAVKLDDDNAAYIDTLAEVHYRKGNRDRATELMKRCVELDAKTEHFRRQLKRFEAREP